MIGSYSGNSLPENVNSNSYQILIAFESNESIHQGGFSLSWAPLAVSSTDPCYNSLRQQLEGDEGEFSCDGYGNNVNSVWVIEGDAGEKLVLTFHSFDTQQGRDVITIYDGI